MESFLNDPISSAHNMSGVQLESIMKTLRAAYYNDQSIVPDNIYDKLEDILLKKQPNSAVLAAVGAPVEFDPRKTKLPFWMGSMDKVKPDTGGLENWLEKNPKPYLVSHKLDGISALLIIDKTKNNQLYTRGDGTDGLDISHLIPYLGLDIKMASHDSVAIRGEIIMSKKNWKKYSSTNSNSRNMVSGLVQAKHPDVTIFSDVDFVAYEIIKPDDLTPSKQFKKLHTWGFKVASNFMLENITSSDDLVKFLESEKAISDYQIDGLILTPDRVYKRNTSGNPKYSIAFKCNDGEAGQVTTVRQVIWSPTRHGFLKPRIEVEPIQVGDQDSGTVTIRFCTAFNAQYIQQNQIGPGSLVEIVRSGDVIPYITKVVLGTGAQMPQEIEWEWNDTKVDILLKKPTDFQNVTVENLTYFFKTMGAKHVSGATITKLVEAGWITVPAILAAPLEEIAQLPGLGQKSAERIRESLSSLLVGVEPAKLMAASGVFGHGMGVRKMRLVTDHYPDCLEWQCNWVSPGGFSTPDPSILKNELFNQMVQKIIKIPGYQIKTAHKFVFNLPNFQAFLNQLPEYTWEGTSVQAEEPIEKNGTESTFWKDQKVVFSGFRNAALEKIITSAGGQVTTGVTSKTTLVLINKAGNTSSKVTKAQELGIPVKSLDEIM